MSERMDSLGAGPRRLARRFLFSIFFHFLARPLLCLRRAASGFKRIQLGQVRIAAAPRAPEAETVEAEGLGAW